MDQIPVIEIDVHGNKFWYLNGHRHREDGPAVEYTNGNKFWYLNDELHRTGGPAAELADGDKLWYLNGKLHRTDGPAVEYANGEKYWYLNGNKYSFEEWLELTPLSVQEKVKLRLMYAL